MPTVLGLILLAVIGTVVGVGARRWLRGAELRAVDNRIPLNEDAIYSNYYADAGYQKATVLELWNEIAATLKVPPGKLRPTDRFGKDIGTYLITSDAVDTLFERAQRRARQLHIAVDFAKITTVDAYVRALAERP
jgi:hypothetical protein